MGIETLGLIPVNELHSYTTIMPILLIFFIDVFSVSYESEGF